MTPPQAALAASLSGIALVTGSSSGIGEGIARSLAGCGMTVVVHSARSVQRGWEVAASIGGSYVQADLRDGAQCEALVREVVRRHAGLDVLVNNAGISIEIPHHDLPAATPAVWREVLDLNLLAPWLVMTAAEPSLRASAARDGLACVLNVSSHAGVNVRGASVPYAVSKAGLNHMTRLLAAALGPDIRVNAIAPGLVDVESTRGAVAHRRLWREASVMGRPAALGEVTDLAASVIANPYLTGQVVLLDGGLGLA